MKRRRRYHRPSPFVSLVMLLWERIFSPIPPLKKGELPSRKHTQAFYATLAWKELSYRTRTRYPPRCMLCLKPGSETNPLVCDHIKPLRFNWELRLDPNNMQILCNNCNIGKGSHCDADYRSLSQKNGRLWWLKAVIHGEMRL